MYVTKITKFEHHKLHQYFQSGDRKKKENHTQEKFRLLIDHFDRVVYNDLVNLVKFRHVQY